MHQNGLGSLFKMKVPGPGLTSAKSIPGVGPECWHLHKPRVGRVGKLNVDGQKVQTCSYKINKYWGCNIQHDDYSLFVCFF